jgi:hypothetical protein
MVQRRGRQAKQSKNINQKNVDYMKKKVSVMEDIKE